MLTNEGTPFNEHGWGLLIADIRALSLKIEGCNDLNAGDQSTGQGDQNEDVRLRTVAVCVDGETKSMKVMGTEPK
jgi:hypothetical protein